MFICIIPFIIQPHCCKSYLVLSHLKKQLRWLTVLSKYRNYFSMLPYSAFPNLFRSIWQTKTSQKASRLSIHYSILPFYKHKQNVNLKLQVSFFFFFFFFTVTYRINAILCILFLICQKIISLGCDALWKEQVILLISMFGHKCSFKYVF